MQVGRYASTNVLDLTRMPPIRILSDRVANQIAAGEVIERPVAVIKELIENSIDAGASRIEVQFRKGGKSYIRIEDNGKGMSPDDALLSLERHATSKISEAVDLTTVSSFGFRGEALPSIASVSRFTMRTRSADWEHGTEIKINGGKLLEKKDCGMPVGTVIEVEQLFNSVPARRKFLKTDETETAHINYNTRLFAVAHPNIAFRVLEGTRTIFQSPACENLRDRIAEIWSRNLSENLIPVKIQDPNTGYRLTGLTAKPGLGRSTRRELVTMVNRRPVDSRTLSYAVLDAYQGRIQKGRFPPAFLFLEIDPQEIDINVHPAKREIRFRNDNEIRRFILAAISETLAARTTKNSTQKNPQPQSSTPEPSMDLVQHLAQSEDKVDLIQSRPISSSSRNTATSAAAKVKIHEQPATPIKAVSTWRLICIIKKKYGLFDTPRGLVMLHIRHADQRIRFERILSTYKTSNVPSQGLLVAQSIEMDPLASDTLLRHLNWINKQGFHIEDFGRHFYRIRAVPSWLELDQSEAFIRDMVDVLRQRGTSDKENKLLWEAVAKLAVEGSYQRSDLMSDVAVQKMVETLLNCEIPHTAPSGKPTFSEISWSEWDKRFGNA